MFVDRSAACRCCFTIVAIDLLPLLWACPFQYVSAVSQCWSIVVSLGLLPVFRLYSCIDQLSLSVGLLLCLSVSRLFSGCIHLSISCLSVYCCVYRSVSYSLALFIYRYAISCLVSQCWSIIVNRSVSYSLDVFIYRSAVSQCWPSRIPFIGPLLLLWVLSLIDSRCLSVGLFCPILSPGCDYKYRSVIVCLSVLGSSGLLVCVCLYVCHCGY